MNAGLNLLRFFLAFNVVIFHLWNAAAPGAGPVAVLGFFFVSGFLVTQIVQEVYRRPGGTWAFLLNRTLRIYPQYAIALCLGLAVIRLYPGVATHVNSYLRWPGSSAEWLPQLAIVGLDAANVRVLPATWTLGTELYFYLVIGLVTARSKAWSAALCIVTLPLGVLCALELVPFGFYGSPVGNAFVFALGSLAYFHRASVRIGWPTFSLAAAAYLAHVYVVPALEQSDLDTGNLAASVLPFSVVMLYLVQNRIGQPAFERFAAVLGKMAYPMFLVHWAVGVLVSAWWFQGHASVDMQGPLQAGAFFGAIFAAVLLCSLAFYLLVDQPVERLRRAVRAAR